MKTAGCDIACPVVWEDGGRKAPSYPINTLIAPLSNHFSCPS